MPAGTFLRGASQGYSDVVPVTPSDSADLARCPCLAIQAGGAGNIVMVTYEGNTRTIAVPANVIIPLKVRRILSTSTTATGILAYY